VVQEVRGILVIEMNQLFHNAAMMLTETLVMVGDKLSKIIGTKLTLLGRLSNEEYLMALTKLPNRPNHILVFFSLLPDRRLE